MIKTRLAPSPTGFMHIGNLRTALFDYLVAKKAHGVFMVRIEDTDRERLTPGAVEATIATLDWAGISPDEGPRLIEGKIVQEGNVGPYIQSERLGIYQTHLKILLDAGHAYHCFCTKERLEELRRVQQLSKHPPGYDGKCRDLSANDVHERLERQEPHVTRLRIPKKGQTSFTDLVRGTVTFENNLLDDQVLMKADGFPTYHLAVVVDDHLMEVTHVIRGEEWLSSTPKHVMLYEMFGWELPKFAHLPLLVNEKKAKLSKRHGDVSVEDFKEKGYLVEALVNFIAFLGWNPGDDREIMGLRELVDAFSIEQVSKSASVFNREKLNWYNKQYMMKMDLGLLTKRAIPFFKNTGILKKDEIDNPEEFELLKRVVALERGRVNTLVELVSATGYIFSDELSYEPDLLVWKKSTRESVKIVLDALVEKLESFLEPWSHKTLEETILQWISERGYTVGEVLWPMRVALSGLKNSPGPFEIASVLGKKKSVCRIQNAISKL